MFPVFVLMCLAALSKAAVGEVNNSYFIVAPAVFRPGQPLKLQVTLSNVINSLVNITSGIIDSKGKLLMSSESDVFNPGTTGELILKIPHGVALSTWESYYLSVNGTGGAQFSEMRYIRFMEKGFTIYIQTDKAVYKPGQNVLMRIFAVHPNLKIYTGNMTVDILDPNGNKMAHWVNINSPSGVIKREFLLSSQPVEGKWKVSVLAAKDQKAEQIIEVKPYVLPKFEVKVELPPYMTEKESHLHGKVNVKYTYGKGAKGRANVQLFFNAWKKEKTILAKDIPVDRGQGSFSFDKEHILQLFQDSFSYVSDKKILFRYQYRVEVNATFHEDLTDKVATGQGSVTFYQTDVKLKFPSFNPNYFKPGLPFKVLLQVTKPSGEPHSPEKLRSVKVKITTSFNWRSNEATVETLTPSDDGNIIISRDIPSSANYLNLQAVYSESSWTSRGYFSASKSFSPSQSYVQLSTTTPSVKTGANIDLQVEANFALSELKYMVWARGTLVKTGTHVVSSGNKMKASFSIQSLATMAPTSRLLVYCIKQDGEIVVDSLNLKIDDPFQNQVSMSIDTGGRKSVSPGDTVTIKGKATPGSFMAFRAVDKSVLLMKEDTDLTYAKVLEELQSYDSARTWYPFLEWSFRRSRRMIMPIPTSGRSAGAIFDNSGVIVITDYVLPDAHDYHRPVLRFNLMAGERAGEPAMEDASAGVGGQRPKLAEVKRIRSLFPETWIWLEDNASSSGEVEFQRAVPDTLTTWVASAFAVSNTTGFGVGELKPQVQVFQSFFVSLNLPYSVVRGEELALQVTVFNYEPRTQQVTITLKGSKHWSIIDEINKLGLRGESSVSPTYVDQEMDLTAEVSVRPGEGVAVSFPVVLRTLGFVPVEVRAQSSSLADAVKRNLLVEPEGIPQEYSISMLLDLNSTSSLSRNLDLSVPANTVKGSARATVSVMGDILGSSMNNLDGLVRMPYGCGEQNMVNFAPNIFVLKYLQTVNQLSTSLENKAKGFMIVGYQREQTYRHSDGSYSAFGGRDTSGSLWLTAFVAKSFAQARAFIPEYIDTQMLEQSLVWMSRQANQDGSFKKVGQVHSSALKGGQTGLVSLTAYVLIALAEANSKSPAVISAKNKAISFLEGKVDSMSSDIKDPYTLAITSYALSLVASGKKVKALTELRKLATEKDGLIYWQEKRDSHKPNDNPWLRPYYRPRSADIEITAYALLAYTQEKDISVGLSISRWLSQQRNSLGGYSSTQDTVIGLQALSEFAELVYTPDIDFTVQLTSSADPSFSRIIKVDHQNSMVLQLVELPNVAGSLTVLGSGRGIGMLQVGVTYNVDKAPPESSFDITLEIIKETDYEIVLKACSMWTDMEQESGMAIMDVGIPSGFALDWDSVEKIMSDSSLKLKRVESPDRKVLFYFDEIPSFPKVCVTVTFQRAYQVGKPQPSTASVYSYYEPVNRAVAQYVVDSLKDESVCRVCPDCVNCDVTIAPSSRPASSAPRLRTTSGRGGMVLLSMLCVIAFKLFQ